MTDTRAAIEVYWRPGCSSCLRMKEFMARSGVVYEEINVVEQPARALSLERLGLYPPAVCRGERCVSGTGLDAVAELIGIEYEVASLLDPAELKERYELLLDAACRYIRQLTPTALRYELPGRDRPLLEVANQTVSVIRGFLAAYTDGLHDRRFTKLPDDVRTVDDLLSRAADTRALFERWWDRGGSEDPLDRVIDTPWWGHRTLHEVLDREVWHTAQHTRQLMLALENLGIEPDQALTEHDLRGLNLPDGIHG